MWMGDHGRQILIVCLFFRINAFLANSMFFSQYFRNSCPSTLEPFFESFVISILESIFFINLSIFDLLFYFSTDLAFEVSTLKCLEVRMPQKVLLWPVLPFCCFLLDQLLMRSMLVLNLLAWMLSVLESGLKFKAFLGMLSNFFYCTGYILRKLSSVVRTTDWVTSTFSSKVLCFLSELRIVEGLSRETGLYFLEERWSSKIQSISKNFLE